MRQSMFNYRRQRLLSGILLAVLLFRAYIPAGFMPASGTPFLLEPCPAAYPAQMPGHQAHHHSGTHTHFENCPFGSAPAAAPIAHIAAFEPPAPIASRSAVVFEALHFGVSLPRA